MRPGTRPTLPGPSAGGACLLALFLAVARGLHADVTPEECAMQIECTVECCEAGYCPDPQQCLPPPSGPPCEDVCTNTTACNTSCANSGLGTTCEGSPYPCTEKNIERTYLFTLKVATLNTWLLQHAEGPFQPAPDRLCRGVVTGFELGYAGQTPEKDYDVVLLQEGFDEIPTGGLFCGASAAGVCRQLCKEYWFQRAYPGLCDIPGIQDRVEFPWHHRHLPTAQGLELNGGLGTLSKFPISFQHNEPWNRCGGDDCYAQKGFLHFRVKHPSMSSPLDFVTLHANANYHEPGKEHYSDREQQLIQLLHEIEKYPHSTFIIGGDFNIVGPPCHGDACSDEWEYFEKLEPALSIPFPFPSRDSWRALHPTSQGFTADECTNTNRSLDCSTGRRERIDYLWYNDSNSCYELEPVDVSVNEFASDQCESGHLSDHFGVAAKFNVWKKARASGCPPPDPDGGVN